MKSKLFFRFVSWVPSKVPGTKTKTSPSEFPWFRDSAIQLFWVCRLCMVYASDMSNPSSGRS